MAQELSLIHSGALRFSQLAEAVGTSQRSLAGWLDQDATYRGDRDARGWRWFSLVDVVLPSFVREMVDYGASYRHSMSLASQLAIRFADGVLRDPEATRASLLRAFESLRAFVTIHAGEYELSFDEPQAPSCLVLHLGQIADDSLGRAAEALRPFRESHDGDGEWG